MKRHLLTCALAAFVTSTPLIAEDTLPLKSVNKANEIIDAALAAHGAAERFEALNSLIQESISVT